jgi:hypothetical protein
MRAEDDPVAQRQMAQLKRLEQDGEVLFDHGDASRDTYCFAS